VVEADRWRFETAVAEVAGNIIKHSTPAGDADGVTLSFAVEADAGGIRGVFVDDGQETGVDLDTVQMPGVQAEDGRGLALAVSLCDVVRYERAGSTNRWTLVCHRIGA
jgi:serine/threonine-protein kinase RsbW